MKAGRRPAKSAIKERLVPSRAAKDVKPTSHRRRTTSPADIVQLPSDRAARVIAGTRRQTRANTWAQIKKKAHHRMKAQEAARKSKPLLIWWKDKALSLLYDSGADGHYTTESMRQRARLQVIGPSDKRVGTANGGTSNGKHRVRLPFCGLSDTANEADTFNDFKYSLYSVGTVNDDGNVSIFTKDDVRVYREEEVLIMCKGKTLLIGTRDERPLQNPAIPTVRAMGTLPGNKAATGRAPSSPQRLQPPFHRAGYQMDARRLWIPRQKHMAPSNQKGQLPRVATPHRAQCQEILPGDCGDAKGTHEPDP